MRTRVNAELTAKWAAMAARGWELPVPDGAGEQLAFPVPASQLAEDVGLSGVHAVPWRASTRERLGFSDWPLRACCGVRVKDTAGGTTDPCAIACQRCLRALRQVEVLT